MKKREREKVKARMNDEGNAGTARICGEEREGRTGCVGRNEIKALRTLIPVRTDTPSGDRKSDA